MGVAYLTTFFFIGALLLFAVLVMRPPWTKIIVAKVSGLFTCQGHSQRIDRRLGMLRAVALWLSEFMIASILMIGLGLE